MMNFNLCETMKTIITTLTLVTSMSLFASYSDSFEDEDFTSDSDATAFYITESHSVDNLNLLDSEKENDDVASDCDIFFFEEDVVTLGLTRHKSLRPSDIRLLPQLSVNNNNK